MCRLLMLGFVVAVSIPPVAIHAQTRRVELKRLCVDCVTVEKGPRLLGAIIGRDAAGSITIAVQRQWLKQTAPAYYRSHHQREIDDLRNGTARLPERVRKWQADRADDKTLQRFLKSEQTRIEKLPKENVKQTATLDSQFVVLTVPAKRVRFTFIQPPQHRKLAVLAWRERLKDIESRSAFDLSRELKEKKVSVGEQPIDLSDRFPTLPDDDRQWAARQALIEYDYRQRLDFQGTGDLLFRTDDEEALPELPQLLTAMFGSQLQNQLGDLLGGDLLGGGKAVKPAKKREFDEAKKTADKLGVRGFRVTRVKNDLAAKKVSVESRFVARLPDGTWETIWRYEKSLDATKKRADLEERIQGDPRVKQALKLVETLGGKNADAIPVLGFAAATMQAQQDADDQFVEYRLRYTKRVDGPVLRWSRVSDR